MNFLKYCEENKIPIDSIAFLAEDRPLGSELEDIENQGDLDTRSGSMFTALDTYTKSAQEMTVKNEIYQDKLTSYTQLINQESG